MLSRFFASRNLRQDDGAIFLRSFLENPTNYLNWTDVEGCLNRDDVFWELIQKDGRKKDVPMYKPYWSPVPCQEKKTIHDHIQDKLSFIITGYSKTNRKVSNLWKVYKNRHTSLVRTTNDKPLNYDTMEIDWEGILSPGDLLYIPNRAYHQAKPDEARLSMSIPCAPSVIDSNFYDRRYYQVQTNN